jgi:hypothetical protein
MDYGQELMEGDEGIQSVGLLLPRRKGRVGYTDAQRTAVREALELPGWSVEEFDVRKPLDARALGRLDRFDLAVIDIDVQNSDAGIAGYLHGRLIPTIRLLHLARGASTDSATERMESLLYHGVRVGYRKDIVRWTDIRVLRRELARRIARIREDHDDHHITTEEEARAYFSKAAKRKQRVFVSYAGKDQDEVWPYVSALRARFIEVFDYRDGKSIRSGMPWIEEIFESLAKSAVAVLMLSKAYFASGNCRHEAQSIVAQGDSRDEDGHPLLQVYPVKLRRDEKLKIPPFLANTQYVRPWEQSRDASMRPEAVVDHIIRQLDS